MCHKVLDIIKEVFNAIIIGRFLNNREKLGGSIKNNLLMFDHIIFRNMLQHSPQKIVILVSLMLCTFS